MTPKERIEAVALALQNIDDLYDTSGTTDTFEVFVAKLAIAATLQSLLEPSEAMVQAGFDVDASDLGSISAMENVKDISRAMIQQAIKEHS